MVDVRRRCPQSIEAIGAIRERDEKAALGIARFLLLVVWFRDGGLAPKKCGDESWFGLRRKMDWNPWEEWAEGLYAPSGSTGTELARCWDENGIHLVFGCLLWSSPCSPSSVG